MHLTSVVPLAIARICLRNYSDLVESRGRVNSSFTAFRCGITPSICGVKKHKFLTPSSIPLQFVHVSNAN